MSNELKILYTNYRGEQAVRRIGPMFVYEGSTEWHPEKQWLLRAMDIDKEVIQDFVVRDIEKIFPLRATPIDITLINHLTDLFDNTPYVVEYNRVDTAIEINLYSTNKH